MTPFLDIFRRRRTELDDCCVTTNAGEDAFLYSLEAMTYMGQAKTDR